MSVKVVVRQQEYRMWFRDHHRPQKAPVHELYIVFLTPFNDIFTSLSVYILLAKQAP